MLMTCRCYEDQYLESATIRRGSEVLDSRSRRVGPADSLSALRPRMKSRWGICWSECARLMSVAPLAVCIVVAILARPRRSSALRKSCRPRECRSRHHER